jgi:4-amino-4-deoxy-L-arabinose transferase-like glycosyltransferase
MRNFKAARRALGKDERRLSLMATIRDHLLIVTVAAIVFFFNLGTPRLWDRDEPRNAGCAREMLQRGDWVVPVFNAELRTHKPVLLYWLIMTAYAAFGVSEFAARFWSAALALGTVVGIYHIGRWLFDAAVGRWAALVLATALMFGVAARAATPDSALVFFSTLGLGAYVWFAFGAERRRAERPVIDTTGPSLRLAPLPWSAMLLVYIPLGFAVLAKGPVGFVLPMAVIGMFLLVMRLPEQSEGKSSGTWRVWGRLAGLCRPFGPRHFLRTFWTMRPVTATLVVLAVALPWYALVGVRTGGAWLEGFFWEHNVSRALAPMEGHRGGPLYYPIVLLVGLFPWSILTLAVLATVTQGIRTGKASRAAYVFCSCWVGVYLGLFTIAQTKLPSYITPAYPATALLTGCFLRQWTTGQLVVPRLWIRLGWGTLCVVGILISVGLVVACHRYLPGQESLASVGLIPLAGGIVGLMFARFEQWSRVAVSLAVTAGLFSLALFGVATVRVDRFQESHVLLETIAGRSPQPQVAAFATLEPSWVFYGTRPIRLIPRGQPLEATSHLALGPDRFLITTSTDLTRLLPHLPPHVDVLASVPYFLQNSRLVVLGHRDNVTRGQGDKVTR